MNLYVVNVTNLSSKFDDIHNLVDNISDSLTKDNRQMLEGNELPMSSNFDERFVMILITIRYHNG